MYVIDLTAAGLSYLGLGLSGDLPDWGLDLSAGALRVRWPDAVITEIAVALRKSP